MKKMSEVQIMEAISKLTRRVNIAIKYASTEWEQGEAYGMLIALKPFINDSEYEDLQKHYENKK